MKYFYYSGITLTTDGKKTYIGGYTTSYTGFVDTESLINYYKRTINLISHVFINLVIEVTEDTYNDSLKRTGGQICI